MLMAALKYTKTLFAYLAICLFLPLTVYAGNKQNSVSEEKNPTSFVKEFCLMTGYASGKLDQKGTYEIIPGVVRLGYNLNTIGLGFTDLLKPVFDAAHITPKGYTELVLEVFVNGVTRPDSNIETGATLLLKYAYPLTEKIYPYGIAGGGGIFLTQHTREQSTQCNFTPQIGGGFAYFLKKDFSVNLEYRVRHLSNANTKEPNEGINVRMCLVGISWYY